MNAPRRDDPASAWPNAERLFKEFEKAWRKGATPQMEAFLPPLPRSGQSSDGPARHEFLKELIRLDLEYRWQYAAAKGDQPWLLEDYARRYPELPGTGSMWTQLIGEEYRARQLWGDRPKHAEYMARFSQHGTTVQELLQRIDHELSAEFGPEIGPRRSGAPPEPPPAAGPPPGDGAAQADESVFRCVGIQESIRPIHSVTDLLASLRQSQMLDPKRLQELRPEHFADSRALARHLLDSGWLTAYQVNQLLLGRGRELVLGPYLLLQRLGQGGAGVVFKALHRKMNRVVALKLIRKELVNDAEVVSRFYREMKVVSRLQHPNIVHPYDAGPIGQTHFLAMEYIDGIDLSRLVKRSGPLPVTQACDCISQAALGLQYAHEKGLVHRDIKPHNLLLASVTQHSGLSASAGTGSEQCTRDQGIIKILDLGLARLPRTADGGMTAAISEGQSGLTPVGAAMMGTSDYMAPEQALDFHRADIRSDIYSLGCTFYFLLTGQPPFPGGTLANKVASHLQLEPPAVERFRKDLPSGLAELLRKMLAKRPEERFQTPEAVGQALAPYSKSSQPIAATEGRLRQLVDWKKWNRRRALIGLAGGLTVGGLAVVCNWLFSSTPIQRLGTKLADPKTPLNEAWQRYQSFRERHAGTPEADQAVELMRRYLLDLRVRSPGTSDAVGAGVSLTELPSPLDRLPGGPHTYFAEAVAVGQWEKREGESRKIVHMAISPDCKTVAGGRADGSVDLWDGSKGTKLGTLPGHKGAITSIVFSPTSSWLASAGADKTIKLWDVGARKEQKTCTVPSAAILAFSPDGKTLAMSGFDWTHLMLWDVSAKDEKPYQLGAVRYLRSLAFSPNGRTLAAAGDGAPPLLWTLDAEDKWKERKIAGLPTAKVLAFAPNSQTMAVGVQDGPIEIWDVAPKGGRRTTLGGKRADHHFQTYTASGAALLNYSLWDGAFRTSLLEISTGKNLWQGTLDQFGTPAALASDGRHVVFVRDDAGLIIRLPTNLAGR